MIIICAKIPKISPRYLYQLSRCACASEAALCSCAKGTRCSTPPKPGIIYADTPWFNSGFSTSSEPQKGSV